MNYIEIDTQVDPVEPFSEILISELCDIGFDSFVENPGGFKAYIPKEDYLKERLEALFNSLRGRCTVRYQATEIEDQNWNAVWEGSYEPVLLEDFCYIHAGFHLPNTQVPYSLLIEPKMSFGTAHHSTTQLMLCFLKELDVKGKSLLDMGCGTGVIAILACMKGAGSVEAIDHDKGAFENALENVEKNHCTSVVHVIHGDASCIKGKKYDLIFANINRNILLNDLPSYAACLEKGGQLFLSGFYPSDISSLTEKAAAYKIQIEESCLKEGWSALRGTKLG